jgi:hypothetical protein
MNRRPKRLDKAFFYPAVNMLGKAADSSALRCTAEVHEFHHRLTDIVQQTLNGVWLDAMHRELSNDLLFVFSKNRGNLTHIRSINCGPLGRAR